MFDAACRHLLFQPGRPFAIATLTVVLACLFEVTTAFAQQRTLCDRDSWQRCTQAPTGYCNGFDCSDSGSCTPYGCPAAPTSLEPLNPSANCSDGYSGAVLVEFVARNHDWGSVWINGKEIFSPRSFNRRHTVNLCPGVYRVVFTGINRLDVWAAGYLDIGRTNLVRLAFSREGSVSVSGDPEAWLLDDTTDPIDIWRR